MVDLVVGEGGGVTQEAVSIFWNKNNYSSKSNSECDKISLELGVRHLLGDHLRSAQPYKENVHGQRSGLPRPKIHFE